MSTSEIGQLINECRRKNRSAQKMIYQTFYGFAMGICLRYANNRYDAAEILNKGFLKVFTSIKRYHRRDSFKTWLGKIMVITSIGYYRSNIKTESFDNLDTTDYTTKEEYANTKLSYDDLLVKVQELSPGCRIVFNLYAIDGYSHEQISKMLNINIKTSESNLFKARMKLKEMILKANKKTK
ncbi:RNA polymerase sigma-70 factor (ECF subfamily) [Mucilaginibacter frigoritolerans]|uniref:RNA polymerase sigma-70 factor (ECF subfamily) n=1 Tax=Mucilaginibacter frigoritolerans TaxID=652788 RepID=A0A562TWX8_9SPHI|nr:sigma-70 family RNA polymerase sigma factor [Mucilaginibacter frigoritolerans]TWI97606.1 RNA polymerase sigma-70 factor (ECF subfamily) [Mucilaginibacter frigoritolerans]